MSKWKRDEKDLVGGIAVIAALALGSLTAMIINVASSEEIGREAPAKVAYQHCAQWTNGYKSQYCSRYATGYETRVVIHKRGIWWDYDTYKVVQ